MNNDDKPKIKTAGEIIEIAIRKQNVNISDLSRKLQVNRRTVYNWFQQKTLHSEVILSIGNIINYDFSEDFKDEFQKRGMYGLKDSMSTHHLDQTEQNEIMYYWMEKYIALVKDYRKLLYRIESEKEDRI